MEHDNSIPSLIEKTMESFYADNLDPSSSWNRPTNAVEWWNENDTNNRVPIDLSSSQEAAEWNLDRFHERLGEASTAAALVWKDPEKPSIPMCGKKPSVARLQDCYLLDLDCDVMVNSNDTSAQDRSTFEKTNINEDTSESLSWPYDSLFFTGASKYSPCLWNGRKRRIPLPSSTIITQATNEPIVAVNPSAIFQDSFLQKPKFHVWNQDPMETSSSMHTRYDPSQPDATTPPPMRKRKRKKKGWNAANHQTITKEIPINQTLSESPKLLLPVRKESINACSSRPSNSVPLPLKWLQYEPRHGDSDSDDSSAEASMKAEKGNSRDLHMNSNTVARFQQVLLQKETMMEADFQTKPNRSLFHRLMYEQTMGVSMTALKNHQKKR